MNGKHTLICAGGIQPKIFSTAGKLHYECVKGDIYMSDMANTHGHVKTVTECVWHPFKHNFFMSSSEDGTIR